MNESLCMVLSAPSGGGKTTLIRAMMARFPNLKHSISYTTRDPRSDMTDRDDYHFISDTEFDRMVKENAFLEWAEVHGKRYGTSRKDLKSLLDAGYDVVLDIDVQGALQMKRIYRDAVYVFILPPSVDVLEERLRARQSETEENLRRRLINAKREINEFSKYNYVVVNDDLDTSVNQIESIFIAERLSTRRVALRQNIKKRLKG
ncbi:guanylate kinase [bacterium]|nr:guanylate kinase [candidate division CSSED10-310 bacterium]